MEKKSFNDNIFGLDFMRTIAILMVLFGHCLSIYPPTQSLIYQVGLFFGFLGVEVFFVLSGFLVGRMLCQLYVDDDFSIKKVLRFLKRRSFRILPNYYLVLILNIIISFIVGYAVADWWKYFFFLQNFNSSMLPFFPESWPVAIGVFAFLLLLVALYLKTALVKPSNKPLFFLLVLLGLTLFFVFTKIYYSFTTQNTTLDQWNLALKALVIYRLDAFFIGVLAAWFSLHRLPFWKKVRFPFAFLGIILFGFMFVGVGFFQLTIDRFPHFWNIFYLPLTSLLCVLFLPILSQWKSTTFTFFQKPIIFISVISYSIYLLHYGVLLQLLQFYFPTDDLSMNQLHLYSLCYFLLTLLLASLLHKFFENPLRKIGDR
jgi:peptidoglycan/LPS O-acetylase OafA/YrhL